jgi:predicted kinase
MKELILLRGLPGSGKSTLAKLFGERTNVEADRYFMHDGQYKFDASKLKQAHEWCREVTEAWMIESDLNICVSNTFTQEWEMEPYFELAKKYGYRVHSIVVENRHGGVNEHGVPEETLTKMRDRFEIKL